MSYLLGPSADVHGHTPEHESTAHDKEIGDT